MFQKKWQYLQLIHHIGIKFPFKWQLAHFLRLLLRFRIESQRPNWPAQGFTHALPHPKHESDNAQQEDIMPSASRSLDICTQ